MPSQTVTMQLIAERAGVSRATVSFALRGRPGVSAAEAKRIRRIAERLGYRMNPLVGVHMAHVRRGVVRPYQATLAYLSPADTGLSRTYRAAARARAEQLGFRLDEFGREELAWGPQRLCATLLSRGIPGVIVGENPEQPTSLNLDWSHFAAATIGYTLHEPNLHRACHAHFRGMTRVIQHLWQEGARRIGYVVRPGDLLRAERLQHAAFLEFHAWQNQAAGPVFHLVEEDRASFRAWLKSEKPDAVISADSRVWAWLAAMPRAPRFASVCLSDEERNCVGILQDYPLIAATAVDLVVAQLQRNERGPPASPSIVMLEGRWADRREQATART